MAVSAVLPLTVSARDASSIQMASSREDVPTLSLALDVQIPVVVLIDVLVQIQQAKASELPLQQQQQQQQEEPQPSSDHHDEVSMMGAARSPAPKMSADPPPELGPTEGTTSPAGSAVSSLSSPPVEMAEYQALQRDLPNEPPMPFKDSKKFASEPPGSSPSVSSSFDNEVQKSASSSLGKSPISEGGRRGVRSMDRLSQEAEFIKDVQGALGMIRQEDVQTLRHQADAHPRPHTFDQPERGPPGRFAQSSPQTKPVHQRRQQGPQHVRAVKSIDPRQLLQQLSAQQKAHSEHGSSSGQLLEDLLRRSEDVLSPGGGNRHPHGTGSAVSSQRVGNEIISAGMQIRSEDIFQDVDTSSVGREGLRGKTMQQEGHQQIWELSAAAPESPTRMPFSGGSSAASAAASNGSVASKNLQPPPGEFSASPATQNPQRAPGPSTSLASGSPQHHNPKGVPTGISVVPPLPGRPQVAPNFFNSPPAESLHDHHDKEDADAATQLRIKLNWASTPKEVNQLIAAARMLGLTHEEEMGMRKLQMLSSSQQ